MGVDSTHPVAIFRDPTERNPMSAPLVAAAAAHLSAHHPGGWGGPGFGWWFLLIPLFWIMLIGVFFAVFGRRWRRAAAAGGFGPGGRRNPAHQAEATLAERFAKGDIDETEYRARLEVLRANAQPG
ncbi:putative membrane protein [Microbacterium sp. AG1240]|nr:putative membrane protein [Microbacterium sp. AG1240]